MKHWAQFIPLPFLHLISNIPQSLGCVSSLIIPSQSTFLSKPLTLKYPMIQFLVLFSALMTLTPFVIYLKTDRILVTHKFILIAQIYFPKSKTIADFLFKISTWSSNKYQYIISKLNFCFCLSNTSYT